MKLKIKKTKTTIPLPFGEERGGALIIGSRGSDLALWQANYVLNKLKRIGFAAEIKIIKTKGDKIQNLSWDKIEGKGFFTKEIEEALLKKEIDLAVHSHKDLPTEETKGLVISAVPEREDPSELLLINKNAVDETRKLSLKKNAVVGTSSARRKSQLLAWRSDVKIEDLRGNVPTRIQKLRDKKYDAILIAYAGVARLSIDLSEFHCEKLDPREFIPAPAQGVLALQIRCPSPPPDFVGAGLPLRKESFGQGEREKDKDLFDALQKINNKEVQEIISVERKVMNLFQGGCQLPLGVFCKKDEDRNGTTIYKARVSIAEKWNSFPKYFYFESKKPEGFAEKIVAKIKTAVISPPRRVHGGGLKVFISRDEKQNDFFKRCLEATGYTVFCQPLIEIKSVPFKDLPKTEWIFFSSKNAVKYGPSPRQNDSPPERCSERAGVGLATPPVRKDSCGEREGDYKVGVIGKSTEEEARRRGWEIDFIGNSSNTTITAKKFAVLVGNKKVLFPQAKNSLRTVQQQLRKEQVVDLVVYETIKNNSSRLPVASCQLLVFTSPSNVEAFFEKNKITAEQNVVAMGNATARTLKKFGIKNIYLSPSFDDLGLVQTVMGLKK